MTGGTEQPPHTIPWKHIFNKSFSSWARKLKISIIMKIKNKKGKYIWENGENTQLECDTQEEKIKQWSKASFSKSINANRFEILVRTTLKNRIKLLLRYALVKCIEKKRLVSKIIGQKGFVNFKVWINE